MRPNRLKGILIFLMGCMSTSAQSVYHFKHLTMKDGLSDAKLTSICQDKYGSMWFGGYGLTRYNGHTMEQYTANIKDSTALPDMHIRRMYCTRKGNLYISTFNGFCRYNYKNNSFDRNPFGLVAGNSRMIEAEDGVLWMNTDQGIVIADEKTNSYTVLANHTDSLVRKVGKLQVLDFATDNNGRMYLGTRSGLYIIHYRTWQVESYTHNDQDSSSIRSNDIQNVVIDHQGVVWLSTNYYGSDLVRFDPDTKHFTYYTQTHTLEKGWVDNRILDLTIDRRGRLWLATLRTSLVLFDGQKESFTYFLHDQKQPWSISSNSIYSIAEDRNGTIWLCSDNSGVDYFTPDQHAFQTISISSFAQPTLVDNWCQAITQDKQGNLWIGTFKGLSYYSQETKKFQNFYPAQFESQDANNSIRSLLVDHEGILWIGTGAGLKRMNLETKKITSVNPSAGLPTVFISYLAFDQGNNILVGTSRGLFLYHHDLETFEYEFDRPVLEKYKNMSVNTAWHDRKGRYIFNISSKGIVIYDEINEKERFFDYQTLLSDSSSLPYLTAIAEDQHGTLWFSTNYGLISIENDLSSFRKYTVSNGLPSNKTSGLLVDTLDRIWIASNKGLCQFDPTRRYFKVYDEKDGLSTSYFYEGVAYRLDHQHFAYPTYMGVVVFNPFEVNRNEKDIPFAISAIKVSNNKMAMDTPVQELKAIHLRHDHQYFTIELECLNYLEPDKTYFAYILEGLNKEWIYSTERIVNYTNIPGGHYVFRYKASSNPNDWNMPEKQLEIYIGTVFYKTWWFLSFLILSGGGITYRILRYRITQQQQMYDLENKAQKLEKEKAMVMYENLMQHLNPHFLFNSLTSLSSLIRVDQKLAAAFLERMAKIYRYILKHRDTELVALRDELKFIQTYVELQQTRFDEGLQLMINVHEQAMEQKIVPVTLQNLIDNAIKHNLIDTEYPLVIEIMDEQGYLVVRNNIQRKEFVESSNKQGLKSLSSLYLYLDPRPVVINEATSCFEVKVPLI